VSRALCAISAAMARLALPLLFSVAQFGWSQPAGAVLVDFEGLEHGRVVDTQFAGLGLTIDVEVPAGRPDLAIVFDSTQSGTSDADLEDPTPVNFVGSVGNLLIINENSAGCATGICSDPDDQGARPAGSLIFDFAEPLAWFGFDLIDIDGLPEENGSVRFLLSGASVATVDFDEIACSSGTFCDPSVGFGDGLANRIAPFTAEALGSSFDRVIIDLGGSGGVDRIDFEIVPEPSTAGVLAGALAALALLRRRGAA